MSSFNFGEEKRTLIIGPPCCGKTSLLFQHSLWCAAKGRGVVLFISPSPPEKLPLLAAPNSQPPIQLLKKIHLKYPKTLDDLLTLFNGIHCSNVAAGHQLDCVIVDDLHKYFSAGKSHDPSARSHDTSADLARTCAHIVDAVEYVSATQNLSSPKLDQRNCCNLILSLAPGLLKVEMVQRWCPSVVKIIGSGQSFTVVDSTTANAPRPIAAFNIHQKSHIKFMNQKEDEREESKN